MGAMSRRPPCLSERSPRLFSLLLVTALGLGSCSSSPIGQSLERSFGNGTPTPATPSTPTTPTASQTRPNVAVPAADPLEQAPEELREPIRDLQKLGTVPAPFEQPNQPMLRGLFARWLVETNNKLFADQPGRKLRRPAPDSPPLFSDVPATNPDFAPIQALAEAGIIPSRLSGNVDASRFQPDQPLTRADLLLWKLPLDLRQPLPKADPAQVEQSLGLQDVDKLPPRLQRALLADWQNGDQGILRRCFGFTTLFQPNRPVSRAEAATALWYFGYQGDGRSAKAATLPPPAPTPAPTPTPAPAKPAPASPTQPNTTPNR